jgi:hypothetical protein
MDFETSRMILRRPRLEGSVSSRARSPNILIVAIIGHAVCRHYQKTLRWLLAGILFLICGLLIGEMTAIHFP